MNGIQSLFKLLNFSAKKYELCKALSFQLCKFIFQQF
jgi:hypothetical protein